MVTKKTGEAEKNTEQLKESINQKIQQAEQKLIQCDNKNKTKPG